MDKKEFVGILEVRAENLMDVLREREDKRERFTYAKQMLNERTAQKIRNGLEGKNQAERDAYLVGKTAEDIEIANIAEKEYKSACLEVEIAELRLKTHRDRLRVAELETEEL